MAQDIQSNPIPVQLGQRAAVKFNPRFMVGGLLLLVLASYLIFQIARASTTTGAYFMTVSEVLAAPELVNQRIRVNGNVITGSENWNSMDFVLKFTIADESGKELPILFYGPRPDNFQRAASAIVEGELQPDGVFLADSLLLKCPSRYEEEPEEVFVESTRK